MAQNRERIDFSTQLQQGADPVSPQGNLLVQAGELEGQAKVVGAKANSTLLAQAAGTAIDAAHGALASGLENDIKKKIDQYELSTKFDSAMQQYDILAQNEAAPEDLTKAQAEITKYKHALDQGLITREQAILSIDKSVKDYSNVLPGYASDLRKLATTLTGVEHMGNYREFALLNKQSMNEKLALDRAKFEQDTQQKMITMFVEKYKRLPQGGLGGTDMKLFREEAALAAQAEGLRVRADVKGATIAQTEPVVVDLVNTRMGQGLLQLNQRLQGIVNAKDPKTGQVMSPENKVLLRQQVLSDVGDFFDGLKAEVSGFNSNQLSLATRETIMNRLNTQHKDLVASLQNQDSFDDFNKTMKITSERASDVMNKWAIANPHLKIIKESGLITPDVAKLWIDSQRDPRRSAEFRKTYGNSIDDFFKSVTTGTGTNYSDNARKVGEDPAQLDRLKATDPGQYQAQLHTLRDSIKAVAKVGWGEGAETQELRKKQFATWLTSFANQIDPSKPDLVKEWLTLSSDPQIVGRISELPKQAQLQAIDPLVNKTRGLLESPMVGLFARLGKIQREQANQLLNPTEFAVTVNPTTGLFQIQTKQRGKKGAVDITGQGAGGFAYGEPSIVSGDGGNLGFGEIKAILDNVNRSVMTLNNLKDIGFVPSDMPKEGLAVDLLNKFNAGYFDLSWEDRNKAISPARKNDRRNSFNPQGEGYDLTRATEAGMKPQQEAGPNQGHMGSVAPATAEETARYGLPQEAYVMLKGRDHKTWDLAVAGEKERGFKIVELGNRYYSVPNDWNPVKKPIPTSDLLGK